MESEKTKGGDPFSSATHIYNESSNPAPSRRHHDIPEFITMSNASEERVVVTAEEEEVSFSEDLALLFVVKEQIWDRLSNPVERETSVRLERGQRDPENWGGFSEQENDVNIQEVILEDNRDAPLNYHQGELKAAHSLRDHKSSLFRSTSLAQIPGTPSEVAVRQGKGQTLVVGFPQALNLYDTFSQTESEVTGTFSAQEESADEYPPVSHDISKYHQNAESSKARLDEDHSSELEPQHELDKRYMPNMEATLETDEEMPSKTEGSGQIHSNTSTKDEEGNVIELKRQVEDVKSSALFQSNFESSKGRNVDVQQPKSNEMLSLPFSKRADSNSDMGENLEELEQNLFICTVLHLEEEEEDGTVQSKTDSLKKTIKRKHTKSNTDCGELESSQKEVLKSLESGPAEMEPLELVDTELNDEGLECKRMENKMETEQKKLELGHNYQEDQDWFVQVAKAMKQGVETELTAPLVTLRLDSLYNLENNLALPGVSMNSSLVEAEGFTFSFKEFLTPDHCPKSVWRQGSGNPQITKVKTSLLERLPPECESPRSQALISLDSHKLESFVIYDQAGHSVQDNGQPTEEDRSTPTEKEDSECAGYETGAMSVNDEKMTLFCRDSAVTPGPQIHPHDSKPVDHPIDIEIHIPTSSLGTSIAVDPLEKDAGKGAKDAVLCEESEFIQEPANQNLFISCQLDIVDCEETSALDSDVDVQAPSKNDTSGKTLHEVAQSIASEIIQCVSLGERLSNTVKQSVEFSLDSTLTTLAPASFQAQDTTISYLEKFHQHQKISKKSFAIPGKEEAGGDTLFMKQQTSTSESPCFLVLEEDETECENASLNTCFTITTDMAQLTKPLTPVPVSDQIVPLEPVSSHLNQLTSAVSDDCREPAQLVTSPPNADSLAQSPAHTLDPSQLLEELVSPSQTCQSTAIKASQSSALTPDTELFDQPSASGVNSNQHITQPIPSSDQSLSLEYYANQPVSMPITFKNSSHSVFPALNPNQSRKLVNSSQIREPVAPEFNFNLLDFAHSRRHHISHPGSSFNKPLASDAQQPAEAPESSLPIHYIDGDDQTHTLVPVANCSSQTTSSVLEGEHLAQIPNMDSKLEEFSVVQLAKSVGAGTSQGQIGWNINETSSDMGVTLLDIHSDAVISGNDALVEDPFYTIPETMSCIINKINMHDWKSSSEDTLHPSVKSQKMPEASEAKGSLHSFPPLAFSNPIHFFQCGPPSPPTVRPPCRQQAVSQGPQQQRENAKRDAKVTAASMDMCQMAESSGTFWKGLEKSVIEPVPAVVHRKEGATNHLPLEKSSSCPNKSVIEVDTKEPASNSKKQEVLIKHRAKSKDWHRHGVRKISIPTDNPLGMLPSFIPSKEEVPAHKEKSVNIDRANYGEKKLNETAENIKRRRSKLINSSRLLYQEYNDVALNKAIQSQKRADSLSEDSELFPRLRRKALSSQDSYLQRLSVSSTTSLWQDIPMVRGSATLLSMTREEQKLQEAKFELIASEASYLRSLNVAVDHFQHSQELQAVLTNQDKQWLFSRLQDVRDVSAYFLLDLEEKLEEDMFTFNVCDVALRHAPEFHRVYLPYVTNQTYQEQTFQRLLNGVPAFQQVLERLESDPVCQRLSLKSFLILPFQRITRLKLLLHNILKRTRPGTDEEVQATQAYDALEKLIKDCNENVQRMKSTEELIYLSKNMEFECKIFPLISQSRRLVKRGELTALEYNLSLKWKLTTRPIYLHLFNDYLLLSRPRENGHFIVFDYAASSDVRGEKCEMKLHGANKNVFRLFLLQNHQGKKVEFLFRTETQSEKLRWISALMPQQVEPDLLDDSDATQVQCVRPYKARENDELALEKADIVMVLQQSSDGWIEGVKLSDGERGWFPSDQVDLISSKHARQMNLKEEQRVKYAKQQVFRRK
ncbi:rho guanine nucleotide exchange factor 5 isoform X2 [Rhineura floridana]|nr:rho guanine nucleotide exchange factor 5 isoform X2 [Rhineura floridana]